MTTVENYISEYEMLVQQIYNLEMRIQDTLSGYRGHSSLLGTSRQYR